MRIPSLVFLNQTLVSYMVHIVCWLIVIVRLGILFQDLVTKEESQYMELYLIFYKVQHKKSIFAPISGTDWNFKG